MVYEVTDRQLKRIAEDGSTEQARRDAQEELARRQVAREEAEKQDREAVKRGETIEVVELYRDAIMAITDVRALVGDIRQELQAAAAQCRERDTERAAMVSQAIAAMEGAHRKAQPLPERALGFLGRTWKANPTAAILLVVVAILAVLLLATHGVDVRAWLPG